MLPFLMMLDQSAMVFSPLEGKTELPLYSYFFSRLYEDLLIFGDALSAAFSRGNTRGKPPVFARGPSVWA